MAPLRAFALRPFLSTPFLVTATVASAGPLLFNTRPILGESGYVYPSSSSPAAQVRQFASKNKPSPQIARQISMGSILGIAGGMGVSLLSKPLAMLLGLGFLGVQFLESRGIHLIPYSFLQKRFKNVNWKSLASQNVAFKLSFGITFTLAAFAHF